MRVILFADVLKDSELIALILKKIKSICLQNMHFCLYLHSANAKVVCQYAKVAQLVEHDLAKVGVASSNLVFRSNPFHKEGIYF